MKRSRKTNEKHQTRKSHIVTVMIHPEAVSRKLSRTLLETVEGLVSPKYATG